MDIWRSGFVRAPLARILAAGGLDGFAPEWLPAGRGRFAIQADPFGITRDGNMHVFVETLDYRTRRGTIQALTFDAEMTLLDRATCLSEPWHLSYPAPISWGGEDFLLPEAHRSGGLTLYRATEFPRRWERAARIDLPEVPVDATPVRHGGLWWLFYSPAGDTSGRMHIAFANSLTGRWRAHPANPVRTGQAGSRPAGQPVALGGRIVLPVQDCSSTYGGSVRPLYVDRLTPDAFDAELGPAIIAPSVLAPYRDGLHTLSQCGAITLFDCKRIDRSLAAGAVGLIGKARRRADRWRAHWPGIDPG